jgi:hypothetical protein
MAVWTRDTRRDISMCDLDPTKADYHAKRGAYIAGNVILEMPGKPTCWVIVGHMSCGTLESAMQHCEQMAGSPLRDSDRHVTRATFKSWVL